MLRSLCAELLDRTDQLLALARLTVLDWPAPLPGTSIARAIGDEGSGYGRPSHFLMSGRREAGCERTQAKPMRSLRSFTTLALFAALCACAPQARTDRVAIPKIPPGMARVWFYREDLPYSGFDRPYVKMTAAVVGISELGGAFYRDVAPGKYYVTVNSYRHFINQFPSVDLLPGETAYFQIFEVGAGAGAWKNYARPSYFVWLMPATVGGAAVARSLFYAGGD